MIMDSRLLAHEIVLCPTFKFMGLAEYWDNLNRHDWYYQFSDDHGVWCAGESDAGRLAALAMLSNEHKAMHEQFTKHYYSGEAWGTPRAPKPERPT